MARKIWIINLCIAIVVCALLINLFVRKKAEIARSNETMTEEIEIPNEEDSIVTNDDVSEPSGAHSTIQDGSADNNDGNQQSEETGTNQDQGQKKDNSNSNAGSSGNSAVELPDIP